MIISMLFIPVFWLFLLPLAGSIYSGLLPIGNVTSFRAGLISALLRSIPLGSLFGLSIGAAFMLIASKSDGRLSEMATTGLGMVIGCGAVIGTILVVMIFTCMRACTGGLLSACNKAMEAARS